MIKAEDLKTNDIIVLGDDTHRVENVGDLGVILGGGIYVTTTDGEFFTFKPGTLVQLDFTDYLV